jgi:hypothetical protein
LFEEIEDRKMSVTIELIEARDLGIVFKSLSLSRKPSRFLNGRLFHGRELYQRRSFNSSTSTFIELAAPRYRQELLVGRVQQH